MRSVKQPALPRAIDQAAEIAQYRTVLQQFADEAIVISQAGGRMLNLADKFRAIAKSEPDGRRKRGGAR